VNPYRSLVQALGRTRGFTWVAARVLPPLDARFAGRRRSVTSFGTGLPLCYLTTTGRRTGAERTVPLLYVADGERIALFASNWGRSEHPAWALNLDELPEAAVEIEGDARPMRARRATDDEKGRLWPQAEAMYPGYAGYRRRAGREVRVYVLEPGGR
jgi:deazaflavin-dependent oxidoreductase (nitroreductase family)